MNALSAGLRQSYHRLTTTGASDCIDLLRAPSHLRSASLPCLKVVTKVGTNILEEQPWRLTSLELRSLYWLHIDARTLAASLINSLHQGAEYQTIACHVSAHAGDVATALAVMPTQGRRAWLWRAQECYGNAGFLGEKSAIIKTRKYGAHAYINCGTTSLELLALTGREKLLEAAEDAFDKSRTIFGELSRYDDKVTATRIAAEKFWAISQNSALSERVQQEIVHYAIEYAQNFVELSTHYGQQRPGAVKSRLFGLGKLYERRFSQTHDQKDLERAYHTLITSIEPDECTHSQHRYAGLCAVKNIAARLFVLTRESIWNDLRRTHAREIKGYRRKQHAKQ